MVTSPAASYHSHSSPVSDFSLDQAQAQAPVQAPVGHQPQQVVPAQTFVKPSLFRSYTAPFSDAVLSAYKAVTNNYAHYFGTPISEEETQAQQKATNDKLNGFVENLEKEKKCLVHGENLKNFLDLQQQVGIDDDHNAPKVKELVEAYKTLLGVDEASALKALSEHTNASAKDALGGTVMTYVSSAVSLANCAASLAYGKTHATALAIINPITNVVVNGASAIVNTWYEFRMAAAQELHRDQGLVGQSRKMKDTPGYVKLTDAINLKAAAIEKDIAEGVLSAPSTQLLAEIDSLEKEFKIRKEMLAFADDGQNTQSILRGALGCIPLVNSLTGMEGVDPRFGAGLSLAGAFTSITLGPLLAHHIDGENKFHRNLALTAKTTEIKIKNGDETIPVTLENIEALAKDSEEEWKPELETVGLRDQSMGPLAIRMSHVKEVLEFQIDKLKKHDPSNTKLSELESDLAILNNVNGENDCLSELSDETKEQVILHLSGQDPMRVCNQIANARFNLVADSAAEMGQRFSTAIAQFIAMLPLQACSLILAILEQPDSPSRDAALHNAFNTTTAPPAEHELPSWYKPVGALTTVGLGVVAIILLCSTAKFAVKRLDLADNRELVEEGKKDKYGHDVRLTWSNSWNAIWPMARIDRENTAVETAMKRLIDARVNLNKFVLSSERQQVSSAESVSSPRESDSVNIDMPQDLLFESEEEKEEEMLHASPKVSASNRSSGSNQAIPTELVEIESGEEIQREEEMLHASPKVSASNRSSGSNQAIPTELVASPKEAKA